MVKPEPVWPAPAVLSMESVNVAARDVLLIFVISKVLFFKAGRGFTE